MKFLILFLLPFELFANCSTLDIQLGDCYVRPCMSSIEKEIGSKSVTTCNKVFVKKKDKFVFDHYSLYEQTIVKGNKEISITAREIKIMEIK